MKVKEEFVVLICSEGKKRLEWVMVKSLKYILDKMELQGS